MLHIKPIPVQQLLQELSGHVHAVLLVCARIGPVYDIVEKYGSFHNDTISCVELRASLLLFGRAPLLQHVVDVAVGVVVAPVL